MHANFADTKKNQELHDTIDSLKSKVKAREAEISRLQHKMDCKHSLTQMTVST